MDMLARKLMIFSIGIFVVLVFSLGLKFSLSVGYFSPQALYAQDKNEAVNEAYAMLAQKYQAEAATPENCSGFCESANLAREQCEQSCGGRCGGTDICGGECPNNCPTETPFCSENSFSCLQCLTDEDCSVIAPRCSNGTCLECLTSSDCNDADECTYDSCSLGNQCLHKAIGECQLKN